MMMVWWLLLVGGWRAGGVCGVWVHHNLSILRAGTCQELVSCSAASIAVLWILLRLKRPSQIINQLSAAPRTLMSLLKLLFHNIFSLWWRCRTNWTICHRTRLQTTSTLRLLRHGCSSAHLRSSRTWLTVREEVISDTIVAPILLLLFLVALISQWLWAELLGLLSWPLLMLMLLWVLEDHLRGVCSCVLIIRGLIVIGGDPLHSLVLLCKLKDRTRSFARVRYDDIINIRIIDNVRNVTTLRLYAFLCLLKRRRSATAQAESLTVWLAGPLILSLFFSLVVMVVILLLLHFTLICHRILRQPLIRHPIAAMVLSLVDITRLSLFAWDELPSPTIYEIIALLGSLERWFFGVWWGSSRRTISRLEHCLARILLHFVVYIAALGCRARFLWRSDHEIVAIGVSCQFSVVLLLHFCATGILKIRIVHSSLVLESIVALTDLSRLLYLGVLRTAKRIPFTVLPLLIEQAWWRPVVRCGRVLSWYRLHWPGLADSFRLWVPRRSALLLLLRLLCIARKMLLFLNGGLLTWGKRVRWQG